MSHIIHYNCDLCGKPIIPQPGNYGYDAPQPIVIITGSAQHRQESTASECCEVCISRARNWMLDIKKENRL